MSDKAQLRFEHELALLRDAEFAIQSEAKAPSLNCEKRWRAEVARLPKQVQTALERIHTYGWQHPVAWAIRNGIKDVRTLARIAYFGSNGWNLGYCAPSSLKAKRAWAASQSAVKKFLAHPWPPQHQAVPLDCGKQRKISNRQDSPGVEITGRYYIAAPPSVYVINQAGFHIEGFASPAGLRGSEGHYAGPNRPLTAFEGEIRGDTIYWFNRYRADSFGTIKIVKGALYMLVPVSGGKTRRTRMHRLEKRPTLYLSIDPEQSGSFDLTRRHELTPLSPPQLSLIRRLLDPQALATIFDLFHNKGKHEVVHTFMRRIIHDTPCWEQRARAIEARVFPLPDCEPKFEGFHNVDLPLVRAYAQLLLVTNKWKSARNVTMSHLQWIERMLGAAHPVGRADELRKYLGINLRPPGQSGQYSYEFEISITGLSVLIGGYTGSVRISSRTGRKWQARYGIELAGGTVAATLLDVKINDTFKGIGASHVEWTENDFYGTVRLAKGNVSAGMGAASVTLGFMHLFGNGSIPVMHVIFQSAGLGVPNYEKIVEEMAKEGMSKGAGGTDPKSLLKPDVSAMVLSGNILPEGGLFERYRKLQRGYAPIDISLTPQRDISTSHRLTAEVHFCLDTDTPTEPARQALRILCARELGQFISPASVLTVIGHADTLGDLAHNKDLSERRAKNTIVAIREILGDSFQIPDKNIHHEGRGFEEAAKESGGKPIAAPKHRRVQIFLNGSLVLTLFGQGKP